MHRLSHFQSPCIPCRSTDCVVMHRSNTYPAGSACRYSIYVQVCDFSAYPAILMNLPNVASPKPEQFSRIRARRRRLREAVHAKMDGGGRRIEIRQCLRSPSPVRNPVTCGVAAERKLCSEDLPTNSLVSHYQCRFLLHMPNITIPSTHHHSILLNRSGLVGSPVVRPVEPVREVF
jgi:hypothetical protein